MKASFLTMAAAFVMLSGTASAQDVTKVYVGGANSVAPSSFLDESNQLTGYDIEVLRAVDELLPQYAFEFQPFEFTGLFAGLDSGRLDIVASSLQKNPQRAEKYIFSVGYINSNSYITFLAGRTDIRSVDDLAGKSAEVWGAGTADFIFFTRFNETNPERPIDIVRGSGDPAIIAKNLVDGRVDAYVANDQTRTRMSGLFNVELDYIRDPIQEGSNVFIIRKDFPELKEAVDEALLKLAADGRLAELSTKWFGGDYTEGATGR